MTAETDRHDTAFARIGTDPGAHAHFDIHAVGYAPAADPRWLRLGIAAALGVVVGTMLFATAAHGRSAGRTDRPNEP